MKTETILIIGGVGLVALYLLGSTGTGAAGRVNNPAPGGSGYSMFASALNPDGRLPTNPMVGSAVTPNSWG